MVPGGPEHSGPWSEFQSKETVGSPGPTGHAGPQRKAIEREGLGRKAWKS